MHKALFKVLRKLFQYIQKHFCSHTSQIYNYNIFLQLPLFFTFINMKFSKSHYFYSKWSGHTHFLYISNVPNAIYLFISTILVCHNRTNENEKIISKETIATLSKYTWFAFSWFFLKCHLLYDSCNLLHLSRRDTHCATTCNIFYNKCER